MDDGEETTQERMEEYERLAEQEREYRSEKKGVLAGVGEELTAAVERAVETEGANVAVDSVSNDGTTQILTARLDRAALVRLAALTERLGVEQGRDPAKLPKQRAMFADAPLMVAVIAAPQASEKIPEVEQTLSAGALCHNLLIAVQAAGWGANWLSGWMATDRSFLSEGLGLAETEWVAGFVVIGTETTVPSDRPRPDPAAKIAWMAS